MRIVLTFIIVILVSKVQGQEIKIILEKSIAELDKIESFEYIEISKGTAAFDTTDFVSEYLSKVIGVRNAQDSIIGYNYISYWRDTSEVHKIYDFDYDVEFNWYSKSAEVTDYRKHIELRERNYAPFYIKARTMFYFALNSGQAEFNIIKDDQDTIVFDILFKRNRYEFMGKIVLKQGRDGFSWSTYTVWLDKKTHLPFKVLRKNEYHKSIKELISYKIDTKSKYNINALESIPDNFSIHEYGRSRKVPDLTGTTAPNFKLQSATLDSISLSDYHGKVILLEFTSIGCGPCHLAIPELTKLYSEYEEEDFEILSIESYLFNKQDIFQRFVTKNGINYPFLIGTREVTDLFKVPGVPYFITIDKDGIIQETTFGFTKGETILKIKKTIEALLK